jgi:hypothetical protein
MANGALGQDPTTQQAAGFNPERLQRRINYLQKRNPNDPRLRKLRGKLQAGGQVPIQEQSPQQQLQTTSGTSADIFQRMGGYAQQFDPATMQSQYDPIYSQEMERARQNVMGQFERQMGPEFQRQQEQFQQMAAERGLDPNSVAYKTQLQQLNERQDAARQQAMSGAESAAQGVQSQMYQQATGLSLLPGQIAGQFMTPYEYQQKMLQLQAQQKYESEEARRERESRERIARIGASSGSQAPSTYDRWIAGQIEGGYDQTPQPNPWAGAIGGFAGGFGQGYNR